MTRTHQVSPLPKLDEDIKASLDLRGDQKTVSTYILVKVVDALSSLEAGDAIDLATDAYEGIRNDLLAWGRLTGHSVRRVYQQEEGETYKEKYHRYVIVKKDDTTTSEQQDKKKQKKVAIIISQDGLLELVSPLGFALGAATSGMDVSLFFQGPGVHALLRGFKGRLSGGMSPFSRFARNGLASIGHAPPGEKLEQLHKLGAKFYACNPSLDHFGVNAQDMAFPDDVILTEYVTFLEVMCDATVKLYP